MTDRHNCRLLACLRGGKEGAKEDGWEEGGDGEKK